MIIIHFLIIQQFSLIVRWGTEDQRCISQIIFRRGAPPVIHFGGYTPPENYGTCFGKEFWGRGGWVSPVFVPSYHGDIPKPIKGPATID